MNEFMSNVFSNPIVQRFISKKLFFMVLVCILLCFHFIDQSIFSGIALTYLGSQGISDAVLNVVNKKKESNKDDNS